MLREEGANNQDLKKDHKQDVTAYEHWGYLMAWARGEQMPKKAMPVSNARFTAYIEAQEARMQNMEIKCDMLANEVSELTLMLLLLAISETGGEDDEQKSDT